MIKSNRYSLIGVVLAFGGVFMIYTVDVVIGVLLFPVSCYLVFYFGPRKMMDEQYKKINKPKEGN
ncbi:MAG: hypothetical protein HKP41_10135 [Desulfobacterales bacterium]|nr:hypothetical protein [Desulfobacterales bacterium]